MELDASSSNKLATALLVGCLLTVCACDAHRERSADPTAQPPTDGARAQTLPTAVSSVTAAAGTPPTLQSATPTASGPIVVRVTLAEAEEEVASWFIPENEASIDGSALLTSQEVCGALGSRPKGIRLVGHVVNLDVCSMDDRAADDRHGEHFRRAEAYAIVATTFSGIDLAPDGWNRDVDLNMCVPVAASGRVSMLAWFDATTGAVHGVQQLSGPATRNALLDREPPPAADYMAVGRRVFVTATPEPGYDNGDYRIGLYAKRQNMPRKLSAAPSPTRIRASQYVDGRELGPGEVPESVLPVVEAAPLVPGAWWRYRVTGVREGVFWWQSSYTETVLAGVQTGSDRTAIQLTHEAGPGALIEARHGPWGAHGDNTRQGLDARGIWGMQGDSSLYSLEVPYREDQEYNYWWRSHDVVNVSTPAGTFRDCLVTSEIFNAMNSNLHWVCPGVGYVRHETPGCSSMFGGYTVYELEDYYIPPIRLVR